MKDPERDGVKFDNEKNDYTLMPWAELLEVQAVLMFGAKKYAPDNWKRVPNAKLRYFSAALRHIIEEWWLKRVKKDHESGEHPLAHAICCLLFIMFLDKQEETPAAKVHEVPTPKRVTELTQLSDGIKTLVNAARKVDIGIGGDDGC